MMRSNDILEALERDGIALIPSFVDGDQLPAMQRAFESRLTHLRANNIDGYDKTERARDMIEDVLLLEQGFVDLGLHDLFLQVAREYVGPAFQLVEAKGWRSRPTKEFHGWHGDAWYDQSAVTDQIPRELKVGLYLTDVRTGGLAYRRGSHRTFVPRNFGAADLAGRDESEVIHAVGPAGTVAIFDTSGIHRQSMPTLERRHAIFYCYHDPGLPLQREDIAYHRYHPLLLNAAFLGGLSQEKQRVLGFGDCRHFIPAYTRKPRYQLLHRLFQSTLEGRLWWDDVIEPVQRRLRRLRAAPPAAPPLASNVGPDND